MVIRNFGSWKSRNFFGKGKIGKILHRVWKQFWNRRGKSETGGYAAVPHGGWTPWMYALKKKICLALSSLYMYVLTKCCSGRWKRITIPGFPLELSLAFVQSYLDASRNARRKHRVSLQGVTSQYMPTNWIFLYMYIRQGRHWGDRAPLAPWFWRRENNFCVNKYN